MKCLNLKKTKLYANDDNYLWHSTLCHIGLDRIQKLAKGCPINELSVGILLVSKSFLERKMIKMFFSIKRQRATQWLELVHSEVCRQMSVQAKVDTSAS